jgi:putative tryptophan/tyrosine transport system substrate-binding protein
LQPWRQVLGGCIYALLLLATLCCYGQESHKLAVIYPATEAPYREVIDGLLRGIKNTLGDSHTATFVVANSSDPVDLKPWLAQTNPPAIITLGRQAYEEIKRLGYESKTIAGALDLTPQHDPGAFGISLAVDPALFFDTLKKLKPNITRVLVVYNPEKTQWIVDKAQALAGNHGMELAGFPANDLAAATRLYRRLLETVRADQDALWIPFDSALVDDELVFPVIIEQAWARRLLVFSNNLADAQHGAVFALVPDAEKLGIRLGTYAKQAATRGRPEPHIEPLQDVKRALHIRFARHLDIDLRRVSDDFDFL